MNDYIWNKIISYYVHPTARIMKPYIKYVYSTDIWFHPELFATRWIILRKIKTQGARPKLGTPFWRYIDECRGFELSRRIEDKNNEHFFYNFIAI